MPALPIDDQAPRRGLADRESKAHDQDEACAGGHLAIRQEKYAWWKMVEHSMTCDSFRPGRLRPSSVHQGCYIVDVVSASESLAAQSQNSVAKLEGPGT